MRSKRIAANSASHRLRHALQDHDDECGEQSHSPVTSDDSDNDFREEPSRSKVQALGPKKSVVNSSVLRREPTHHESASDQSINADNLFDMILEKKADMRKVVQRFLDAYQANQNISLQELINLLFQLSGCSQEVPEELWNEEKHDLVECMEQHAPTGIYLMAKRCSETKLKKAKLCAFIRELVISAKNKVLYDGFLFSELVDFLGSLANNEVRAYRHTGTFFALKLMTSFALVVKENRNALETARRCYEAAVGKEDPASIRLKRLVDNINLPEERIEYMRKLIMKVTTTIVTHRWGDPISEIKLLCLEELGNCMLLCPEEYLVDANLKYIRLGLLDPSAVIQLAAVKLIAKLFEKPEFKHKLDLFISNSKKIFVCYAESPELDIRVNSIVVLNAICQLFPRMLSNDEIGVVLSQMVSNNAQVAMAAGAFAKQVYFSDAVDCSESDPGKMDELCMSEVSSNTSSKKWCQSGRKHQSKAAAALQSYLTDFAERRSSLEPNSQCLIRLASFIESKGFIGDTAYVVDALWNFAPMLQDWIAMVHVLLAEDGIDDELIIAFTEVVVCAAERATLGYFGTPRRDRPRSFKEEPRKKLDDNRAKLSEILIPAFPLLLDLFSGDADKLEYILRLPRYFDMSFYTSARLEPCMVETMRCLNALLNRHIDLHVLDGVAEIFGIFCDPSHLISSQVVPIVDNIVALLLNAAAMSMKTLNDNNWAIDDSNRELYSQLSSAMRRLASINLICDLNKYNVHKPAMRFLRLAADHQIPSEVSGLVEAAAKISYASLFWHSHSFCDGDETLLDLIKENQTKTVDYCRNILTSDEYRSAHETIYASLSQILILFAPVIPEQLPSLEKLHFQSTPIIQDTVVRFISSMLKCWGDGDREGSTTSSQDPSASYSSTSNIADEPVTNYRRWMVLQTKRALFAQFVLLVRFYQFDLRSLVPVIRYYQTCHADFGDLFKEIIVEFRARNQSEMGEIMHEGLQGVYLNCIRDLRGKAFTKDANELQLARKIAYMLSQSFGIDVSKVGACAKALHTAGIKFVFSKKSESGELTDLPYFELLRSFTAKLLVRDRLEVKIFYDKMKNAALPFKFPENEPDSIEAMRSYELSLDPKSGTDLPPPPVPLLKRASLPSHLNYSSSPSSFPSSPLLVSEDEGSASKRRRSLRGQPKKSDASLFDFEEPKATSTALKATRKTRNPYSTEVLAQLNSDDLLLFGDDSLRPSPSSNENEEPTRPSPAKRSRGSGLTPLKQAFDGLKLGRDSRRGSARAISLGRSPQEEDHEEDFHPISPDDRYLEPSSDLKTLASSLFDIPEVEERSHNNVSQATIGDLSYDEQYAEQMPSSNLNDITLGDSSSEDEDEELNAASKHGEIAKRIRRRPVSIQQIHESAQSQQEKNSPTQDIEEVFSDDENTSTNEDSDFDLE